MDLAGAFLPVARELAPLAALFGLIGAWTWVRRGRRPLPHVGREFGSNVLWYVFDGLVVVPSVIALILACSSLLGQAGLAGALLGDSIAGWHIGVQFMLAVLASDVAGYWRHRLLHHPWLWPAHAVHHSDVAVHWLTLVRVHPTERWANAMFDTVVLGLLGFPAEIMLANNLLRHYYGFWLHVDCRFSYGPLRHVFVSPAFHRWHHATAAATRNRNFAVIFSFIDRLFGTYYLPDGHPERFGISDEQRSIGFLRQLWLPVELWLGSAAAIIQRAGPAAVRRPARRGP